MRKLFHLPAQIRFEGLSSDERRRLEPALLAAIRRAVESVAGPSGEIVSSGPEEVTAEVVSSDRYRTDRDTYAIPSYDNQGQLKEIPVEAQSTEAQEAMSNWEDTIKQHLVRTFGTYEPRSQTYYGVQTATVLVYGDIVDGETKLRSFNFYQYKKDTRGDWQTATPLAYPKGRYIFTVTGKAEGDHPHPNVAIVTDIYGEPFGHPLYTSSEVGWRLVFDVPETILPAKESKGSQFGTGIMGRGSGPAIIYTKCHGYWNTNPLSDPAFAGASDDDYWNLFLNLCNARALDNLNLSEKYIREELVARYVGPGGSTKTLSNYSRPNVRYFQEDLQLLRGLLVASNKIWTEILQLESDRDTLIRGGQLPGPSFQEPPEPDHYVMSSLAEALKEKRDSAEILTTAILRLIQQDPLLTQFISGFKFSDDGQLAPRKEDISSKLADVASPRAAQKQILTKLNETLHSIARARHKLCDDPERILDVPLVYKAVQTMVAGINPRFDQVVKDRIAEHQSDESWIDIGLSAAGLVLFVGGLIVSFAGGPGGVVLFLELSGTSLGAATAARSFSKADFFTAASESSVLRGGGMITLKAARDARFWATVDAVLLGVDAGAQPVKLARTALQARKARALSVVAASTAHVDDATKAARALPFEELFERAAPRGRFQISDADLAQVQLTGPQVNAAKGRIAEEAVERTVSATGEYVQLATLFQQGNLVGVGIDLLCVRRSIFEKVFGKLGNPRAAARIFGQATEEQQQQFIQALRRSANAEDLISFEVKFTKHGLPVEELFKTAHGGVQQTTAWYRDLMTHMMKAADTEVQATGRLLQEIIGANAQDLGRLSRIGISVDPQGGFKLQRLTDEVIDLAQQSKALYDTATYRFSLTRQLLIAVKRGDNARLEALQAQFGVLNRQIDALDAAVRQAKEAEAASRRALAAMQQASQALEEIAVLSTKPRTAEGISLLHIATATARLYLEVVQHSSSEADGGLHRARKIVKEANEKFQEDEKVLKEGM